MIVCMDSTQPGLSFAVLIIFRFDRSQKFYPCEVGVRARPRPGQRLQDQGGERQLAAAALADALRIRPF